MPSIPKRSKISNTTRHFSALKRQNGQITEPRDTSEIALYGTVKNNKENTKDAQAAFFSSKAYAS
jgi:hypothetical protein